MAILLLLMFTITNALTFEGEMALANVTRFANGDIFSLAGPHCGLTRCMEVSRGTALASLGSGNSCVCQCRRETPTFREDQRTCVNHIDECPMASFGRGANKPQIPFVFLPLKGQIIYPSKEIIFTDVEEAICAVTSAQYLSPTGWVTLRDLIDNDVPFGLYRDEGSTYLQWRGSPALHSRLEGRLVAAHVLCSAPKPNHLATSCAAFRVAGVTHNTVLDVRSIPFHAGETVTTEPAVQSPGLSVLESLAIGVCVLMLVFVYATGIIFYIHYKQKQRKKTKDPELNHTLSTDNASTIDSRISINNMRIKNNPLMNLDSEAGLSDVSERTEDTFDSSSINTQKMSQNSNVVSAVVHSRRKKPSRPTIRATSTPERLNERLQRRSASPELEKAPHSDLSILHCSMDNNVPELAPPQSTGEPIIRKKLYFNPVFFEVEHLKNPPPAAIDFLCKLREVMSVAKEKMTSKRFIPILSDIPEEELYHTIDLGWDIHCARRGRRFSAISLKRENSRRSIHCGGCPGCDNNGKSHKATNLIRSNSCKTCVSDDYKQRIVQKWLDEAPSPSPTLIRPVKSVAKVSGTPRVIEPKGKEEVRTPNSPIEVSRNVDSETIKITETIVKEYLRNITAVNENVNIAKREENNNLNVTHKEINDKSVVTPISAKTSEIKSQPNYGTRRVRKKLPPPPPPPMNVVEVNITADVEPVLPEVKKKMEAVIRELNKCKRIEPISPNKSPMTGPKLVIPVTAEPHYFSDDNLLSDNLKKDLENEKSVECDSLERRLSKKRRFSLDHSPESQRNMSIIKNTSMKRDRLTRSWRDFKVAPNSDVSPQIVSFETKTSTNDIFINGPTEPIYNNVEQLGPLTIQVRGSPVENRRKDNEDFDPDTLDRKPKRIIEETTTKKCVEKILLKSGGSFKHKLPAPACQKEKSPPEAAFTRKIGSLRQIYEAKNKTNQSDVRPFYERRGSVPYGTQELAAYMKNLEQPRSLDGKESKPPVPPKNRGSESHSKGSTPRNSPPSDRYRSSEERDRFPPYSRNDNLNARRSGRRSSRTRPRRVDLKKFCRTEDSGYLSTDSNESKRRARYLMHLKPKLIPPEVIAKNKITNLHIDTDTDELESLCDGHSESGGESVETDSVFFRNFEDPSKTFQGIVLNEFESQNRQEQIDSGFLGETNIILSGDSDSEHRSVISIVTGRDGRASASSITNLEDSYVQSVECS
ncbi:unnamed protein product [Danaus chrysippus]|uniref:(African queen) hypothetical protein n=1 Tax=Danaus chrysippus TaxID=151541 RepID=A0A8J2VRM4_9NEOP|nr:unnamed protein product [Danaus chrysippus]